jgi:glycosyltransferase involved in cell wall biosynthesis
MATGLFPVVSDIKANSAWLKHGVDGLLHKVGDAEDLAEKIMQFRDSPQLLKGAAEGNRKRVIESGDRKTNMKHLETVYVELVKKRR